MKFRLGQEEVVIQHIEEEPSTSFKGLGWERTKNHKAQGDRFLFDFLGGGAFGKVLVVLRVFYDLA